MYSTFSQESAASALALNEPECEPSRSVKSSLSPVASSQSTGPMSPVTPTLENSPPTASEQTAFPWMSSAEVSPARISAQQERARALGASAAVFGKNTPELLANFDPATSSWRTSQRCLVEGWTSFSETWPRSGTMQSGIAFQLQPLVRLTDAIEYGLWPTPAASDVADRDIPKRPHITKNGTLRHLNEGGIQSQVRLSQSVKLWPTLAAVDAIGTGRTFPRKDNPKAGMGLRGMVTAIAMKFNTPRTTPRSAREYDGVSPLGNGGLNPTWVEWLMGFPLGWTDCGDSVTPSSLRFQKSLAARSSRAKKKVTDDR